MPGPLTTSAHQATVTRDIRAENGVQFAIQALCVHGITSVNKKASKRAQGCAGGLLSSTLWETVSSFTPDGSGCVLSWWLDDKWNDVLNIVDLWLDVYILYVSNIISAFVGQEIAEDEFIVPGFWQGKLKLDIGQLD